MRASTLFVCGAVFAARLAQHACFAQEEPEETVALQGTFVRPADGIEHPDLSLAWADYRAAIDKAITNVEAGLEEAIQEAKKQGDFKAVIQRQAALGLFQNKGIFPTADFLKDDTHAEAARAIRRANAGLMAAYGEVCRALTKREDFQAAKIIDAEQVDLEARLGFPPISNVPWPLFDGKDWLGWGTGWGQGRHDVIADDKAIRLTGFKCFSHARVLTGDMTFEVDFRIRPRARQDPPQPPNCAVQVGVQTDAGACLVRIPARDAAGQIMPGKAEVIHFNNLNQQTHVLVQFDCPPAVVGKWRTCRFSRRGNSYSVAIDGKDVVNDQPLPDQVRQNFNLHIGVGDGIVEFRNLRLTEDVPLAAPKP